jgi:transcriptional regulator with PAS, ATPase and Fis domain
MLPEHSWIEELPAAVTVTDAQGVIVALNARARETFAADGGAALVGRSVFDCHPEPARSKLEALFAGRSHNHYTIRRDGMKKIIHQMPWYTAGAFAGYVEISIPIPDQMEHFERK